MEKKHSPMDDHSLLFEAVREAELLLDFISRQGSKFDKEMASAIVKAKHLFASGNWQPAKILLYFPVEKGAIDGMNQKGQKVNNGGIVCLECRPLM